jgi:DNA-binding transcriptional LysR family regulator
METLTDSGEPYYERVRHFARDLELAHAAVVNLHTQRQVRLGVAQGSALGGTVDSRLKCARLTFGLEITTTKNHQPYS